MVLVLISASEAGKCYCYNGMGAIEAGITSACVEVLEVIWKDFIV